MTQGAHSLNHVAPAQTLRALHTPCAMCLIIRRIRCYFLSECMHRLNEPLPSRGC